MNPALDTFAFQHSIVSCSQRLAEPQTGGVTSEGMTLACACLSLLGLG